MPTQISGKNLGALAMPDFCPRCFWFVNVLRSRLPFQIFPGIFSSIDSYTKKFVHGVFELGNGFPPCLDGLGPVTGYREPPSHNRFRTFDDASQVLLTGAPDAVFETPDGILIADYKTARYTPNQDSLAPIYEVQLNAYAYIAATTDLPPVRGLALIYFEPETEPHHAVAPENHMPHGFRMGFAAYVKPIPLDTGRIPALLQRAREILERDAPPTGREGCKDCMGVAELVRFAGM